MRDARGNVRPEKMHGCIMEGGRTQRKGERKSDGRERGKEADPSIPRDILARIHGKCRACANSLDGDGESYRELDPAVGLYLSSTSPACACGSSELRSPSSAFETAPEAPIIGFRTASGTARTTARTGPCKEGRAGISRGGHARDGDTDPPLRRIARTPPSVRPGWSERRP